MIIEDLRAYGADVDTGIKRCVNKESLYLSLLKKVAAMEEFQKLEESIHGGDLETAFSYAHGLKGNVANLSITPIEKPLSEITELLRVRTEMDYSNYLQEIHENLETLRSILAKES